MVYHQGLSKLNSSGVSGNDFWEFGNGMKKTYSKNSGTGRALKRSIPKIREREGNDKIKFPHFGNGNRKLSFPGRARNGNENGKKKQNDMII